MTLPRTSMPRRLALLTSALAAALSMFAAPTAGAALQVGVVGPDVLVRPADAPVTTPAARLLASGNEFESVQVVARAEGAPVSGLDVTVTGALSGPGGATVPASAFTVYRVGYYDSQGYPSDGDLGGALGSFPDSLIPRVDTVWGEPRSAFPIDVPAGQNRLAWIDVLVPRGTPAGRYTGASIRVAASGAAAQTIPLEIDVIDLDLPSTTSLDGGFDINPNRVCAVHSCSTTPGGASGVVAMYERIALDNRLTLAKPPNATPSGPDDASYRTWTRPLLMGTAPTRLRGARLRTVTIYQWAVDSAGAWRRAAEADGFVDRVRFHCDEIATSATAWSRCRSDWTRANTLWRAAAASGPVTDLPLQVTTSLDDVAWARANGFADLADRIAVLIPVVNRVHPKSMPAFPGRRAAFDPWTSGATPGGAARQLWSYTSCMSMGCSPSAPDLESEWRGWPSYGIDQPGSEARAMGWLSWTYGLAGEYYYETARDLPSAWTNQWSHDGGNHGDGTLFYPGLVSRVGGTHDVPIESIRLKRIRDGREDYEWLRAAEASVGRARVLEIARGAYADAHHSNVPQARIHDARRALALIVAGGSVPAPAGGSTFAEPVTGGEPPAGGTGGGTGGEVEGGGTAAEPVGGGGAADGGETTDTRPVRGTTPAPGAASGRRVTCGGRRATIIGSARRDVLRGTPRVDVIAALGGNDTILGLGGADIICAGAGADVIVSGRDGRARDLISCGTGRDRSSHDVRDRLLPGCERRLRMR